MGVGVVVLAFQRNCSNFVEIALSGFVFGIGVGSYEFVGSACLRLRMFVFLKFQEIVGGLFLVEEPFELILEQVGRLGEWFCIKRVEILGF